MAGLFGVLGIANRGLVVAQQGIQNSSQNIANVNTPGYSRQRQIVSALPPIVSPNGNIGTGVEQTSVERIADSLLQGQRIKQNSFAGSTDVQANALSSLEEVLNEQRGDGIGTALSRLYSAFSELSAAQTPGAPVERQSLVAVAQHLVDTLHAADAQMRDMQHAAQRSIEAEIPEINRLSAQIADLNRRIVAQEGFAPANELRDQRDMLVRELSGKIQINAFEEGQQQMVLLPNGLPLVEGRIAHKLVEIGDPTNPFSPSFTRVGFEVVGGTVDVTDDIGGGTLGGLLGVRDDVLAAGIRSLDTIAYNLASSVNATHALGVGLDGSAGDFFQAPAVVEDAARDLAIDARILASTDAIAAGLSTAVGDNRNALALAALRNTSSAVFLPGDPPGPASGPSRSLLDHVAGVVADVGHQASAMESSRQQQADLKEILENRRDAISGVSIDEEVTALVELQAAFQANARVMQTVDRLLQDLLSIL